MKLTVLGSTGSIGVQALDVARLGAFEICALTAGRNASLAETQAREFKPAAVVMCDEKAASDLRVRLADTSVKVFGGAEAICECAAQSGADTVLNAIVGIAGLAPTLAAAGNAKRLALANKESIVAGGEQVMKAVKLGNTELLPVDSEHSAIFQCLDGRNTPVKRIILTASGGPFFGRTRGQLSCVTAADALHHPVWSMGAKITTDSATLFNKGLEIIEAAYLFGVSEEKIHVVIHPQSILHSAVEFEDGSVIGQLGNPDMRLPIQYALTWPERTPSLTKPLELETIGKLTFFQPDYSAFRGPLLCRRALRTGGTAPAAANGANEAAVKLFLEGKIGFCAIDELIEGALDCVPVLSADCTQNIFETDSAAKRYVAEHAGRYGGTL